MVASGLVKPLKAVIVSCLLYFVYHVVQKSLGVVRIELGKAPLDTGMITSDSRDRLLKHKYAASQVLSGGFQLSCLLQAS